MKFELFLVFLACLFTSIGGILDILDNLYNTKSQKERRFISKQHFWNDGIFLILLAIFISIYKNKYLV
jgi:hypothetical protein